MQALAPNAAAMFSSWARGAEASTPPVQDAFRDIFANRLMARMAARSDTSAASARSLPRLTNTRPDNRGQSPSAISRQVITRREPENETTAVRSRKEGDTAPAAASSDQSRQASAAREKRREELHRTHRKPESRTPAAGLAADQNQAASQASQNQGGGAAANPPPALQNLISFLQSFPGGSMTIAPDQVPQVASYLKSAGLPQAEVDRLLNPAGSQEITLNAADLQAAWQRVAGQETAGAVPPEPSTPPAPAANVAQEAQEIQQTPGYKTLWERLAVPENMLPTLRLALANLGATPEALAQLQGNGPGQGVPLTRVWQVLQDVKNSLTSGGSGDMGQAAAGASPTQAEVLASQPVTGAETEQWRQVLLQAGLQPEVVQKLLGEKSPGTQEDLKTSLLAMAPSSEEPTPVLAAPKPLYQPQDLQMRPFFWQSQQGGDQPQLNGDGSPAKDQSASAQLATLPPAPTMGENFVIPTFAAELQGLTQGQSGTAAPLSVLGTAWRLLPPEVQESLWTQLQPGVTTNVGQGESQVTLNLNPPELGQIQLTLNLSGQDLAVSAVATRPEVAELATMAVPQLVQALAQQGLVLTDFQVRLQDQPERQFSPALAGAREKGGASGGNSSASNRRRAGEVDRFV